MATSVGAALVATEFSSLQFPIRDLEVLEFFQHSATVMFLFLRDDPQEIYGLLVMSRQCGDVLLPADGTHCICGRIGIHLGRNSPLERVAH